MISPSWWSSKFGHWLALKPSEKQNEEEREHNAKGKHWGLSFKNNDSKEYTYIVYAQLISKDDNDRKRRHVRRTMIRFNDFNQALN